MSDAKHGRFEIDLDEIERQLRRSADAAPAPKSDPLAELARIVGQDDPFRGLFGNGPSGQSSSEAAPPELARPPLRPTLDPVEGRLAPESAPVAFSSDVDTVLHGHPAGAEPGDPTARTDELFDPVADTYGSLDGAMDQERYEPLPPPRSRKSLVVVGALVVASVVATAGWLAWRDSGVKLASSSGTPPVIRADSAPLKVAPENPGGMEIPDQNKQIYERGPQDGQTRVVDRQEQPIDVREAARALPPSPAAAPPQRANPVASALGDPRRVRTVSVRPDGTLTSTPTSAAPDPMPQMLPSGSLPPPVPVATIPITIGGTASSAAPTPAAPAATPSAAAGGSTPSATLTPVPVLPPRRPKFDASNTTPPGAETDAASAASRSGQRVAGIASPDDTQAASAGTGRFSVQLGVRASEQEARAAYAQLASKYPELGGRSPAITRADVGGKTVYRVRVGPLSRDDANTLCNGLKTSGGQCIVLQN